MRISEAFATFGAKQKNVQWSVSAISESGELIVSLWDQFFEKREKGALTYVDQVSRWGGAGNKEFVRNLDAALAEGLPIRVVVAKSKNRDAVAAGDCAANLGGSFDPKKDWLGSIVVWDGDNFEIEFRKE